MDRLHRKLIAPTVFTVVMAFTGLTMLAASWLVELDNDSIWPFAPQLSRWSIAQRTEPLSLPVAQPRPEDEPLRITDGELSIVVRLEESAAYREEIRALEAAHPGKRWAPVMVPVGTVLQRGRSLRPLSAPEAWSLHWGGQPGRCWIAADGQRIVMLSGRSLVLLHPHTIPMVPMHSGFPRTVPGERLGDLDQPLDSQLIVRRDEELLQIEVGKRVLRVDLSAGATGPLSAADATLVTPALGRRLDHAAQWLACTLLFGALWIGWLAWFSRRGPRFWPLALAVTLGSAAAGGAALLVI